MEKGGKSLPDGGIGASNEGEPNVERTGHGWPDFTVTRLTLWFLHATGLFLPATTME